MRILLAHIKPATFIKEIMGDSLRDYHYSVWGEFTPLAIKHEAVNLGQGFPAFPAPSFIKEALYEGTLADYNQYTSIRGFPHLVQQICRVYSRKYGREINPQKEVLVTIGANEALMLSFQGLLNPGDEVVLFDPSFDLYYPMAAMVGAQVKTVPLRPPPVGGSTWEVDWVAFENAFTSRTRMFLINTPHNPLGKIFTPDELQRMVNLLERFPNVWIVSDEVYEHLVFGGRQFRGINSYANMWRRCGTISSAGKLFCVTGWKTGWVVGGEDFIRKVALYKQWTTFNSNTPCQYAIARALEIADKPYQGFPSYYAWLHNQFDSKRATLLRTLPASTVVELEPLDPEGGYFVLARIKSSDNMDPSYLENTSLDYAVARWLTIEHKVTVIPCSSFFTAANKSMGASYLRFALCKNQEDYDLAAERLQRSI